VVLDVAHNPNGFDRLLEALEFHFPGKRFSAVIGMSADKDVKECLSVLTKKADYLYLVDIPARKSVPLDQMQKILQQAGYIRYTAGLSIGDSIQKALEGDDLVVICGSFYLMQQARDEILRIEIGHNEPLLGCR
jgi:dihydrofolate synthase / folylpolyglutamate synthase